MEKKRGKQMTITISHRGIVIAECKSSLEAFEKIQKWECIFKPLVATVNK